MNEESTHYRINNDSLAYLLLEQPKMILNEELALITLNAIQARDQLKINEIEAVIKSEVAMNLALKNEDQRRASMAITLKDNIVYQELKIGILIRDLEIRKAMAHLAYQRDLLRVYLAIASMEEK